MQCPSCGCELSEVQAGTIKVDVCRGGCGGIWFDRLELQRLDEPHESCDDSLLGEGGCEPASADPERKLPCPLCSDVKMMRIVYAMGTRFKVDHCGNCGGHWLDPGELREIRAHSMSKEQRMAEIDALFVERFGAEVSEMAAKRPTEPSGFHPIYSMACFLLGA